MKFCYFDTLQYKFSIRIPYQLVFGVTERQAFTTEIFTVATQ